MDSVDFEDENAVNNELAARRRMARESRVIDMMGRLHADIFQNRYMLNEVGVKHIKTQRESRTVIFSSTSDRSRTKICDCAPRI